MNPTQSTVSNYGQFHEDERCFELTAEPPRKWRNTHYTEWGGVEMYNEVSNLGDGFCRIRDPKGNTCLLVGYDAKYFYIRDEESGVAFNPWGAPCPTPASEKSCRYYPERTEISGVAAGLRVTQRVFVPRKEPAEITTIFVENLEDRPRQISVFAYALFQLTGCDSEGKTVYKDNSSEVLPEMGGVIVRNRHHSCPAPFYNGYLIAAESITAATGYRDNFTRSEFSPATPRLFFGEDLDNQAGLGPDCCGAVQIKKEIPAGGRLRLDFAIGACENEEQVRAFREKLSPETIDAWLQEQTEAEIKNAAAFRVGLGEEHANRSHLINIFVKKQMYSYLVDKSGFRDNMQIDNAIALFDYPTARANVLSALASQRPDGAPLHSFRPLNRHLYSDKPAWILMTVPWLIKESGDFDFLKEKVPYFESEEVGTVWDHTLRALRYLASDLGKNGLCDQHFADWNDQLEPSKDTGARESVMVSQQLCLGALEIADLADRIGESAVAAECRAIHAAMSRKINEIAWDGEWYQRTVCEDGYRLGSSKNKEASIFVNTQSWAVLGQVADEKRALAAMGSVDRFIETPLGFVICAPPFTKYDSRIGKFCRIRPGFIENGGAYCHAAGFKLVADCMLGRAEEAWRTFLKVAPDCPTNPITNSEIEPFSFTNCYQNVDPVRGKSGYPWRTGTAGWFTMGLVEWILGARRHYDGLLMDPCLSATIPEATLRRRYRGATYEIHIDNRAGRCKGTTSITVDGKPISGSLVPAFGEGVHQVSVVI